MKIGTAPLMSPSAADGFYGTSTTSSHTSGLPTETPPEIVTLARALKNDPDLIYQYVRNNIAVVWEYGLQKGALGASIDKSGTPFDQAALMVAILRQAGFTATYEAGTITLNQSQFQAWTNITGATAACKLLSGGGIPAVINGSTTADCNYGNDPISTVQMAHVWVKVSIPSSSCGTNCLFDPSYKTYSWKPGIDLAAATGLTTGAPLAAAGTGMSSGSSDPTFGLPYASHLNGGSLNTLLQGYASNLQSYLAAHNLNGAEIEDIVSGGVIAPITTSQRVSSLAYSTSAQHEWTGGVPDQYRTTLEVSATMGNIHTGSPETLFDKTFYVDEMYGRRLTIRTNFTFDQITNPSAYNNFVSTLCLDDQVLATHSMGILPTQHYPAAVTLTVNHPYAANVSGSDGDYMDATLTKDAILVTPISIVAGFGDVGPELLSKWSGERAADIAAPGRTDPPPCPAEQCISPKYDSSTGDYTREKAQANFLEQYTRAAQLHAAIANGIVQTHHVLGLVYADDYVDDDAAGRTDGSQPDFFVTDSYMRIDVDTGLSFASKTADAAARRAAVQAIAATSAMLEGTMAGQLADVPDTSSTATRFEWGNNPSCYGPPDDPAQCGDPSGAGPRTFFGFAPSGSVPTSWVLWEASPTPPAPSTVNDPTGNPQEWAPDEMNALKTFIDAYTAAGFSVTASQESFLGPGQRGGYIKVIPASHGGTPAYVYAWTKQRGGAFVATRYDENGDPAEIAHDVVGLIAPDQSGNLVPVKGGGGGSPPGNATTYNPATAADILKSRFVDRTNALGVNLSNGSLSYSSPASINVGNGDFPYALSAGFSFHQGAVPTETFGPIFPGSAAGWIGSWDNALSISSSGIEGMGGSDVRAAAVTIAAFLAEQDIYRASPGVARDVAGTLSQAWLSHQYQGNVVTVMVGGNSRQFVRLADGSFVAPGASYATLTQTGTRAPFTYLCPAPEANSGANYALSRGWDASGLAFTVTNANGDQQHFGHWLNHYDTSIDKPSICGRNAGFRLDSWTFPQGMTVTLNYGSGTQADGNKSSSPNANTAYPNNPFPQSVSNSIGRALSFATNGTTYQPTVSDGNGRTLTGPTLGVPQTTDALGVVTNFTFNTGQATSPTQRPIPYWQFLTVGTPFLGTDPHTLDLQYDYDGLGHVLDVRDAVNLQVGDHTVPGGRDPYGFRIADGTRGERDDPLGNPYAVVYDTYKHPWRYIDELGRVTTAAFDSRGRVLSYTYPEGDCESFAYDDRDNTTDFWKVDKTSSCNVAAGAAHVLHVSATWDATWNKPLTITNARGITTTFTYYASGTGASLMASAVRPADGYGNGAATYSFTYTAIGRPLDATDPDGVVTENGYDGAGNLTATTVDPAHLALETQFAYDAVGNVITTTDPRGNATTTTYDLDRRKLEEDRHDGGGTAAFLAAAQSVYEAHGWVTDAKAAKAVSGTSVTTWITTAHTLYTPTGKAAAVTDADGQTTVTAYDALDRVLTVTDPLGKAVHNAYDAAGQLLVEYRGWGTPLQQSYATHTWTPNGKEASVTDALGASHLTQYVYDGFDRLLSTIYADASHEDLSYDANGNVLTRTTRAGPVLSYAYDALDRLRVKTVPWWGAIAGHAVGTSYSLAGRVTGASDSAGPGLSYSFDTAGRATAELQLVNGVSRTVFWTLDANGNHTRLTWPDSFAVDYSFDALNRMSTAAVHGGAGLAAYGYDPLSRRTALSYNGGTSGQSYAWSDAGDLLTLTNTLAGGASVAFTDTYTPAHQLEAETVSNPDYVFPAPAASSSYAAVNALNQYPSIDGGAVSWDANGNLGSLAGGAYAHDPENRLVKAGGNTAYGYDPLGRRVARTTGGGATNWGAATWGSFAWSAAPTATTYLHDGDAEIAEYDTSGALIRRFVPGAAIDEPIAMIVAAGSTTFFHTDRKGSVIAMADTSGARVEGPYTYDAYGNCFVGASTTSCTTLPATAEPFRYTGQRFDPDTGLYYYRARYYVPTIGRFAETDPAGYAPDVNWYTYVGNDPTDREDPSGMCDDVTGCNPALAHQEADPMTQRAEQTTMAVGAPVTVGVGIAVMAGPTTVVGTIAISGGVGGSLSAGHSAAQGNSPGRVATDAVKGTVTSAATAAGGRLGGMAVKGGVVPGEMAGAYAGTKAVGGTDTEAKVNAAVSGFVGALFLPLGTATSSEAAAITSQVLKSFVKGEVKTELKNNLPKPSGCSKNGVPCP